MKNSDVSVIIPVYNADKHIKKCVNSVLNQTYKNFEIILVNDGSTDNSGEICREYAKNDSRVVFINKDNGGVSSARNSGIDIAEGKYIMFVDSDDFVDPEIIEVLLSLIKEKNADISICGIRWVLEERDGILKVEYPLKDETYNVNSFLEALTVEFESNSVYGPWSKMFSLEKIKSHDIRFDEKLSFGEDVIFVMQYLERCRTITSTKRVLYNYSKDNTESITNSFIENSFNIGIKVYDRIRNIYKSNDYSEKAILNFEYLYLYKLLNCVKLDFVYRTKSSFSHRMKNLGSCLNDKYVINSINKLKPKSFIERILFFSVKYKLRWFLYAVLSIKFRSWKSYWFPKWKIMKRDD